MKQKKLFIVLVSSVIILTVVGLILIGDKTLDLDSNQVKELYGYLGDTDINHCGGLQVYSKNAITSDDIDEQDMMCMAYYKSTSKLKDEVQSTGKNEYGTLICRVGENLSLAADEDGKCEYEIIDASHLKSMYLKMYGKEPADMDKFYITDLKSCFLEGDKYICGEATTFNYSISAEATIYRLIDKAVQKNNGDIIIYDYFLKVSDDKCYKSNSNLEENMDCTKALSDKDIDQEFIRKYGTFYEHFYKKDSNGHHWVQSKVKK